MAQITTILDVDSSTQELLEVAGFSDVSALAKVKIDDLVSALEKANDILKITDVLPKRELVEEWIHTARRSAGTKVDDARQSFVHGRYSHPQTDTEKLAAAAFAIPLPTRVMAENGVAVTDIPPAIFLRSYAAESIEKDKSFGGNQAAETILSEKKESGPDLLPFRQPLEKSNEINAGVSPRSSYPESRLDIDTSRLRTFEELTDSPAPQVGRSEAKQNDRVALIRSPLEKTNRGKNPNSRFYIKGVLHTHPFGMAFGAMVTLLLLTALPLAVIASALLFISQQFPEVLSWAPRWLLVFPLSLPVLGLLYLIFGVSGKCRICGQRQFWPRDCRKNSKAHHIPVIGYIIPTALHMLTFKWFRCIYCGTPVRLKK